VCGFICSGFEPVSQSKVDRVPVFMLCRVLEPAAYWSFCGSNIGPEQIRYSLA
jgi:hypothetical protein